MISSQQLDQTTINYFTLNENSGVLKLSNVNLNYEALSGSKRINLRIQITDDSPDKKSTDYEISIDVIDANEEPYFTNLSHIPIYADEYVDFSFDKIEWTDTDEGQNPTLVSTGPEWLIISDEGQMQGQPTTSDIGNNSFVLTINDNQLLNPIEAIEEINIEVRENTAPIFTNINSIPTYIKVGCYDDNDLILDINWKDPDNNAQQFLGNDIVTFSHEGTELIDWLNIDENGRLFCVNKPENSDADIIPISIFLSDDRPNVSLTTLHSFYLELISNDAPEFVNLSNFPDSWVAGDTLEFDINWQDLNDDIINFSISQNLSWLTWDNSGNITATPDSNDIGSYDLNFNIDDDCYYVSILRTLTIE